ncbi:MAG: winged helix-turn-helix transcriptional regulator [Conexibacter sp.]
MDYERQDCSLARALEVVGERWALLIVRDAFYGVRRFKDFHDHLDIPRAVLTERLNSLVDDGVLAREPDPAHAGRHLYVLTRAGEDLWPAVHALLTWGDRHRAPNSRRFRHAACATPLDTHGACPACGVTPEPADVTTEPRPGRRSSRDDPVALALRQRRRLLEPLPT